MTTAFTAASTWTACSSDRDALEAFLRTFTDAAFINDPKFSDPFAP
jgi:hypothetical protein